MIQAALKSCEDLRTKENATWHDLQEAVPYSTVMRWKSRLKKGEPLLHKPGPKKIQPLDWEQFHRDLASLPHGRCRTRGTGPLYARYKQGISRRGLRHQAARCRQEKLQNMKRIHWKLPGLVWSIDGTEYTQNQIIIPVQDLASHFRFAPLLGNAENGEQIAQHLERLFQEHGAPLFLKKDNGSPYNNQYVDEVLRRYGVLPLNNPPRYPRYNGSMEKSIRDLKEALNKRIIQPTVIDPAMASHLEATIQELNHKPSRLLKGQTPCHFFHAWHWKTTRRQRNQNLRLILSQYSETIATMPNPTQRQCDAIWRHTVESWLVSQGLITVRLNHQPKTNVSTNSKNNWSHN